MLPSFSDKNTVTIIDEDSLINEVRNVNKIIPLEVELSESILVDKSFGDFEILKKTQKITFFAKCSYSMDLSTINKNDILLDRDNKTVTISLTAPEIFSITIDENKTQYGEPELGLLRFGDIALSSEEYGNIRQSLYDAFRTKMKDNTLTDQVITNTKDSLQKIISDIIGETYTINIKIKN